jgi:peptide deformylase
MQLPIYLYGQQVLRKATEVVTPEYPGLSALLSNMFETMTNADGVGLAAPQVGLSLRLFVIDLTPMADENEKYTGYKKVFINPEILSFSEETCSMEEGCLSVPDIHESVTRSNSIKVRYQDENFRMFEEQCSTTTKPESFNTSTTTSKARSYRPHFTHSTTAHQGKVDQYRER